MRTFASLKVKCSDPQAAERLRSVLAPDNGRTPKGLSLELSAEGDGLKFTASSESSSTSVSTCLGVLRDASLFQEVWLLTQSVHARASRE